MGCFSRLTGQLALIPLAGLVACSEPHADAVAQVRSEFPAGALLEFERVSAGLERGSVCGRVRDRARPDNFNRWRVFRVEPDGYVRWLDNGDALSGDLSRLAREVAAAQVSARASQRRRLEELNQRYNAAVSRTLAFYTACDWQEDMDELGF